MIEKIVKSDELRQNRQFKMISADDRTLKKFDDINDKLKQLKKEFCEKKRMKIKSNTLVLPSISPREPSPIKSKITELLESEY